MEILDYKNTKIAYSDTGKGVAIVFLHGFLENQNMWEFCKTEFCKKYRIITLDLLGHGGSENMGYLHTMEDNADLVNYVLTKFRIRKAYLVGHSMGGYVALAFAEMFPEKMKGLILLNSTAQEDSEERKNNRNRAIIAAKEGFSSYISQSIQNLFATESHKKWENEIEKTKAEALKTPLQGIISSLEGMKIRKDRTFILKTTTFPKLLILGEKDAVLNFSETKKQVENTDTELISLSGAHMLHVENKEEVLGILAGFFRKKITTIRNFK